MSKLRKAVFKPFIKFLSLQASSSVLLLLATAIALVWANSPWAASYHALWHAPFPLGLGAVSHRASLHFWINDALMALFFLLVGLEIKRELIVGELSSPRQAALPAIAAIGGMIVPALLYFMVNPPGSAFQKGWGIPTVTDIAFAIGILTVLGSRVPLGLKVFLTALAIVDDLGAIALIGLFYSGDLSMPFLLASGAILAFLLLLNRARVAHPLPYLLLGFFLWIGVLNSGLHATIAGVLLALAIPARHPPESVNKDTQPPLQRVEHALHPWVSYGILPLFALANAGVGIPVAQLGTSLAHPVTLGIVSGLFLGKQAGITLFAWLAVRLKWAELPRGVRWPEIYGASFLGGIGFTMSLFIAGLAFRDPAHVANAKIGILLASLLSAMAGILVLLKVLRSAKTER